MKPGDRVETTAIQLETFEHNGVDIYCTKPVVREGTVAIVDTTSACVEWDDAPGVPQWVEMSVLRQKI